MKLKSVRQVRKADKLLSECEDFFVKEHGKSNYGPTPFILSNDETKHGILFVNNYKDLMLLKRIYGIFQVIEDLLPKK